MNWPQYFQEIAKTVSLKSKDNRAKLGAVIVGPARQIVSTGYNSFPRGIDDNREDRQERPEKYYWMEHAERNAIYNAARSGVSTEGCTLYLSRWFPCHECVRGIINAGITDIYCDPLENSLGSVSFDESFLRAFQMANEAGIRLHYYEVEKKPNFCTCRYGSIMTSSHPCKVECKHPSEIKQ